VVPFIVETRDAECDDTISETVRTVSQTKPSCQAQRTWGRTVLMTSAWLCWRWGVDGY